MHRQYNENPFLKVNVDMDRLLSDVSDAAAMEVLKHFVVASYGTFGDYVRDLCRQAAASTRESLQIVLPPQPNNSLDARALVVEVASLSEAATAGYRFYMLQVFSSAAKKVSESDALRLELCVPFSRDEKGGVVCVFKYIGDNIGPESDVMLLDEITAPLWGNWNTRARVFASIADAAQK